MTDKLLATSATNLAKVSLLKQVEHRASSGQSKVARQHVGGGLGGAKVEGHAPLEDHHHHDDEDHRPQLVKDVARLLRERLWRRAGGRSAPITASVTYSSFSVVQGTAVLAL